LATASGSIILSLSQILILQLWHVAFYGPKQIDRTMNAYQDASAFDCLFGPTTQHPKKLTFVKPPVSDKMGWKLPCAGAAIIFATRGTLQSLAARSRPLQSVATLQRSFTKPVIHA